jgi:UTP--glucose-1-phosphate uridylyltransferase
MKIKKAVILAAGLGTRMLPATKSVPKELFPIVDKPALQYLVEEVVASGIESIMIVISRGKTLIEDHFDRSPELEERLIKGKKEKLYDSVRKISDMADILYVRQKETLGTGHALLQAKAFTGDEPFAVLYGDNVIMNDKYPVTRQLMDAYDEFGLGIAGVQQVTKEAIQRYSSMKVEPIKNNYYTLTDMIEKPKENEILSLFSILGRLVLPAEIYDILGKTPYGAGNELQLTDAMKTLANTKNMIAVDFVGKRYDMGNKLGVMQAQVETALKHPEIGEEFKAYLKEFVKTI